WTARSISTRLRMSLPASATVAAATKNAKNAKIAKNSLTLAASLACLAREADLQPKRAVLGVVERPEQWRAGVGLHVGRQERAQRVVGADADPGLQLEDREAMLDAELQPRIGWKPELVAGPDEIERLVHRGIRQTRTPVGDAQQQPSRTRHRAPAREQTMGGTGGRRAVSVGAAAPSHNRVQTIRDTAEG